MREVEKSLVNICLFSVISVLFFCSYSKADDLNKELEHKISQLEVKLVQFQRLNKTKDREIEELRRYKKGYDVLKPKYQRLESSFNKVSQENRSIKYSCNSNKYKLNNTEIKLDKALLSINRNKNKLVTLEKLNAQLANDLDVKKQQLSDLRQKCGGKIDNSAVLEQKDRRLKANYSEILDLKKENKNLRDKINLLENSQIDLKKRGFDSSQELQKANNIILSLTQELKRVSDLVKKKESDYNSILLEASKQKDKLLVCENSVGQKEKEIIELSDNLISLKKSKKDIKILKAKVTDLQLRLNEANNLIMVKNAELLSLGHGGRMSVKKEEKEVSSSLRGNKKGSSSYRKTLSVETLAVRVIGEKVNLRLKPGKEHSPIQQVARGTELIVESKTGEWYRIITPTGRRAYVKSDLVEPINSNGQVVKFRKPKVPRSRNVRDKLNQEESQAMKLLRDAMRRR